MKLKVQVDDDGAAYVAAIDPDTGEHRKAATVGKGQELNIDIAGVTSADELSFSEVAATGADPAPAPDAPPAEQPGGGNEGSASGDDGSGATPAGGGDGPTDPESPGPDAGDQGGGETPAPTTSEASEKPLYLVDGDTQPVGFEASGLETPDGKTLYHFAGDTAGQSATGNADTVSVYADADDNEKPVKPADSAEEVVTS